MIRPCLFHSVLPDVPGIRTGWRWRCSQEVVDPNECNQKGSIGYTVQMIFSTITPIYTINEASFQRLHLNFVLPQEFESDPSGVFLKIPVIWCYKLYFRMVSSFWFGFKLQLVSNVGHNVVMQLCRVVTHLLLFEDVSISTSDWIILRVAFQPNLLYLDYWI